MNAFSYDFLSSFLFKLIDSKPVQYSKKSKGMRNLNTCRWYD